MTQQSATMSDECRQYARAVERFLDKLCPLLPKKPENDLNREDQISLAAIHGRQLLKPRAHKDGEYRAIRIRVTASKPFVFDDEGEPDPVERAFLEDGIIEQRPTTTILADSERRISPHNGLIVEPQTREDCIYDLRQSRIDELVREVGTWFRGRHHRRRSAPRSLDHVLECQRCQHNFWLRVIARWRQRYGALPANHQGID